MPSLKSIAGNDPAVIYASSFSKILAPGVRVAWTVASPELIRAMVLMRQGEDLCTSTVTQALVAEYPLRERLWAQLMVALYRCDRQAEALRAYHDCVRCSVRSSVLSRRPIFVGLRMRCCFWPG